MCVDEVRIEKRQRMAQEDHMKKRYISMSVVPVLMIVAFLAGCSKSSTGPSNNPPNAPTNLTATQSSRLVVALSWSVAGADSVRVQSSLDSANWQDAELMAGNATALNDSSILADTHYFYRVNARNSFGTSGFSNVASIWTLPAIYDFATDQTGHFTAASLGNGTYHIWEWDQGIQAGKMTITNPTGSERGVSLLANFTMNNSGWFQSNLRVQAWHGTGDSANYAAFFIEKDPADMSNNIIGLWVTADSTLFGHKSTASGDHFVWDATNATGLPLLDANSWHTIRIFHLTAHWDLYIDGSKVWSGEIPDVAMGGYQLHEEWQFNPGAAGNPVNQAFWVDDVANDQSSPVFMLGNDMDRTSERSLDERVAPKRK
jgi:hypothetical protein